MEKNNRAHQRNNLQSKINTIAEKINIDQETMIRLDQELVSDLGKIQYLNPVFSHADYDKQLMSLMIKVKAAMINDESDLLFHFIDGQTLEFEKVILNLNHQNGFCYVSKLVLH